MNMTEHQKTWDGFMAVAKVSTLVVGALIALLTAWLGAGVPFFSALVGVVLISAVIAYLFR